MPGALPNVAGIPPSMAMPVVLTGTLRAVASDVGSGSCRRLRRYRTALRTAKRLKLRAPIPSYNG